MNTKERTSELTLRRRCRMGDGRVKTLPAQRVRMELCRTTAAMPVLGNKTVLALVHGGFVQATHDNGKWQVCMTSLLAHFVAASDPKFWTAERSARYLAARKPRP